MTSARSRIVAATAALSLGAGAAWADEPTPQDLKIKELEAKIAALEARVAPNSQDVSATIESVLRDAERRSRLLATNGDMSAGYDNGFFIRAGDAWVLRPGAQFQFRYAANLRDNFQGGDEELDDGFEVRRMKFSLEGTAFTKNLKYNFTWATNRSSSTVNAPVLDADGMRIGTARVNVRNGGDLVLEDAYVSYMFADDWGVRVGQYKDPVYHEELVSSKRQLAADRSLVNEQIGGGVSDRIQGVSLLYGNYNENNPVSAEIAIHDGINSDNTSFQDAGGTDFGIGGRFEWKAMGKWRSYRDFTAMGTNEDLLVIGLGGDWSQDGNGNAYLGTIDAQWENTTGWSAYAAFLVTHQDQELLGTGDDNTDYGGIAQLGYMVTRSCEIFGRYGIIILDEDDVFEDLDDDIHEITLGFNYYLGENGSAGHRAKFTVDLTYLPNGAPGSQGGIGVLNANGDEDEFILRGQFQLLI